MEAIRKSQATRNRLRDDRENDFFSRYFAWLEVSKLSLIDDIMLLKSQPERESGRALLLLIP